MGVAATFVSASLVRQLGILKVLLLVFPLPHFVYLLNQVLIVFLNHQAGAFGLIFQASLLTIAVAVYWSGSLLQQSPLLFFLCMIVRIFHFLLSEKENIDN